MEIKSGGKHTWTSVKGKIHRKKENMSSFLPVLSIWHSVHDAFLGWTFPQKLKLPFGTAISYVRTPHSNPGCLVSQAFFC